MFRPALDAPKGIQRLLAACEEFLSHIDRGVFPGGCFFSAAAADVGTRPGPLRDAIAAQLAFELWALLVAANTSFILQRDAGAFERARRAIRARLRAE